MPFSHHSHSGQFCQGHAVDRLEDIILAAISKDMQVFALTEHMPRHDEDRYPEELATGITLEALLANEAAYVAEASRLREKYKSKIGLPIGFECEWIRAGSRDLIQRSISTYPYDFFVGSVHHVHTVPIDYDHELYHKARDIAGGTDERLFEDYFDAQLEMLQAMKPPVVGHLDLIRLKSDNQNGSFKDMSGVWDRILRNLDFIASYGGIVEINFAAVRKGMDEPYPNAEICEAALRRNIELCLSDDSHGISQVATNYSKALPFLEAVGCTQVAFLQHVAGTQGVDERFPSLKVERMSVHELREHKFWGSPHST